MVDFEHRCASRAEKNYRTIDIGDAWEFVEAKAGECMSTFIEKYLRPVLLQMTAYEDALPRPITLKWEADSIHISSDEEVFRIERSGEQEDALDEE
ncbi:hypothetical protein GCAAIG_04220 [Candidatus Electronema halotolerans]